MSGLQKKWHESAREPDKLRLRRSNVPNLNQPSIFDTFDGRLGGLCGGEDRAATSSFFGDVGRDQGATGRLKSGLERRFSLTEVGCANEAEAGIGGGGMRGS
jgi:hypothetical protein